MIGIASGVIDLGLAIPLAGYVIPPGLNRRGASCVEGGPTDRS
jgi:hypothetical protein